MILVGCSHSQSAATSQSPARSADLEGEWAKMRPITPRGYVCYRAQSPVTIDGQGNEPAWANAPWTADFVDIEDASRPKPRFRTRAKMLWDDHYFYIYAELEEPHVWATITQKNAVIFNDNDFEVFIDPNSDNHNYYEYEMNALNTIWELTLPKPYKDGGNPQLGTNIPGLRSAVHVNGTLNDPRDTDKGWSVEIAIPWTGLARYAEDRPCPPRDGEQWRIDFSRVEWLVDIIDGKYRKIPKASRDEDNWVWSPTGIIDMHRPERWGYVQFSTASPGSAHFTPDPTLAARDTLMGIYYREREFHKRTGRYTASLSSLGLPAVNPPISLALTATGYTASLALPESGSPPRILHVREDSRLWIDGKS